MLVWVFTAEPVQSERIGGRLMDLRDELEEMPSYHALLAAVHEFANGRVALATGTWTERPYPGELLTYVRRGIEQLGADVEAKHSNGVLF